MADLIQVTNQLKTLNEKTDKLTSTILATNNNTEIATQTEVQTNTEIVKNDDEVIDGQNESNEKLGFLGKTFQKISSFLPGKAEKKEADQKQMGVFNKIGGFLKENSKNFATFFSDSTKRLKDTGLTALKGLAIGGLLLGVIAFLESPYFDMLLDMLPKIGAMFDSLVKDVGAFMENPSFMGFLNIFGNNGLLIGGLAALIALFNPFGIRTILTSGIGLAFKALTGIFKLGSPFVMGIFSQAKKFAGPALSKMFQFLGQGTTKLFDGIKNVGSRLGARGKSLGSRVFSGLSKGISSLMNGISTVGSNLTNTASKMGSLGNKAGTSIFSKLGSVVKGGGKLLAGAAKFAGPVGLLITGTMAAIDGVTAGVAEYNKEGSTAMSVARESLAGIASGLTFGFVSQDTISKGLTSIGNKFNSSYDALKNTLSKDFEGLKSSFKSAKKGFMNFFGFDDEEEKGLSEVEKRKNKIQEQIARLESIAKGGVNNREMKKLRDLGIDTKGVANLKRGEFVGDEIAKLREQLANMNNNMKEPQLQGGPPNMNTVTDASVTNNNNNQTVVTPLSHENKDRPQGTGMLAYE
tara:strand:- start:4279 stop:6012 length:1734 start_codon:yes stop_codon:yes gene_type:complete